jgi:hypothetical protein
VSSDGSTLQVSGNLWTKINFNYNVTPYTVLEFDFRSDQIGYDHVIGWDNDASYWDNANWSNPSGYILAGSDTWPGWNQSLKNYSGTDWKTYSIRIGQNYTGLIQYLFFVNSLTTTGSLSNSLFRNIRVYDINPSDTSAPTASFSFPTATVTNGKNIVNASTQYQFTVTYTDSSGINLASLDNSDIQVLSPNGSTKNATLVSTSSSSDRKTVTVTYKIFDNDLLIANQNNEYLILLQANQVSDLNYNFLTAQTIGRFTVV